MASDKNPSARQLLKEYMIRMAAQSVQDQAYAARAQAQQVEDGWLESAVVRIGHAIDHDQLTGAQKAFLRMKLACDLLAEAQAHGASPESPGQSQERTIAEGVETMCHWLKDLLVVPAHVEQLGEAVHRAKRDRAALRAMR